MPARLLFPFSQRALAGNARSLENAHSPLLSTRFLLRLLVAAFLAVALFCAPAFAEGRAGGKGRASWYGLSAHGKPTANGEIYDRRALTAAHKEFPFGTVVRVYNLRNGRHVLVRVNDRGPFVKGRVLDVSRRAAEALRMTRSGVISVALEVVSDPQGEPLDGKNGFFVHIANEDNVFKSKIKAAELEKSLKLPMQAMFSLQGKRPGYALCAGPYKSFDAAQRVFLGLEKEKLPALGIIEGPADGGDLPRRTPPGHKSASGAEAKTAARKPSGAQPQVCPLPAQEFAGLDNGTLLRVLLHNMLPGLTGYADLFLLPSSSLSGYLLSSSQ